MDRMLDGYYNLTETLNINRTVSIRAAEAGKAVLNGQGNVRVLYIETSGMVDLVGLQITGGYAVSTRRAKFEPILELASIALALAGCHSDSPHSGCPAAGNFLELTFDLPCLAGCKIASRFEHFSELSSIAPLREVSWN